jgi:hypothetical protein
VSENRVLRRIFGPKGEEVAGDWRRLYKEELHNLYSSPNFIRVIKSGMRGAGHVARVEEMHTVIWLENLKVRVHSEDLGVDGKIILEWILGK